MESKITFEDLSVFYYYSLILPLNWHMAIYQLDVPTETVTVTDLY